MADTITKTATLQDVTFLCDNTGAVQEIDVRYLVTVTDQTTGASYAVIRGPFQVSPSGMPNLVNAIQNGFTPPAGT